MTQTAILAYIPQRPPFVMIDKIIMADEKNSVTSFEIRDGHLFVENGYFNEAGLVENMAQTAAAGTGYHSQQDGKTPPIGYIGALKGLNIFELPKVGDTITTKITFIMQVMNAHIVQAVVIKDQKEIANCELKIFLDTEIQNA